MEVLLTADLSSKRTDEKLRLPCSQREEVMNTSNTPHQSNTKATRLQGPTQTCHCETWDANLGWLPTVPCTQLLPATEIVRSTPSRTITSLDGLRVMAFRRSNTLPSPLRSSSW